MMRSTPMARAPFQRKNTASSTRANGAENKPQNVLQSHSQQALVAIKYVVKMQAKIAIWPPPSAPVFRGSFPKARPVRNETYRRAVASLPCVICGVPGYSQAAHGSAGKGMGIKACDLKTLFPACADRPGVRGCHSQLDQGALFTKDMRHVLEPVWAANTQRFIYAMGKWPKGAPYPHDQQPDGAAQ